MRERRDNATKGIRGTRVTRVLVCASRPRREREVATSVVRVINCDDRRNHTIDEEEDV